MRFLDWLICGALFGPLLGLFLLVGLFLLGAMVPRSNAQGALLGLGAAALAVIFPTDISPWWYGALTCIPTLVVGALGSLRFAAPPPEKLRGLLVLSREPPGSGLASGACVHS